MILLTRISKFRVRITGLRHRAENIDLVKRKGHVRCCRFPTSNQTSDCLQGAIHQAGMQNELTKIAFQMIRYFQLGLEGRAVVIAIFPEFVVISSPVFSLCTLRSQRLDGHAVVGFGPLRQAVPESQPSF
jgi:hypothetical protein